LTDIQTLDESRSILGADGYRLDSTENSEKNEKLKEITIIPQKNKINIGILEAISSIYENTALLGDIARRLPHILLKLWNGTDSNKKKMIEWAIQVTQVILHYTYYTTLVKINTVIELD